MTVLACTLFCVRKKAGDDLRSTCSAPTAPSQITLPRPDDWHLHLRDGPSLTSAVPHSARVFKRAIIMPNLIPPITTYSMALQYKQRIMRGLPADSTFEPLMTCYLTDNTTPDDVEHAAKAGIIAYKLYPAGATTNSNSGVTDLKRILPALHAMASAGVVLCVHGEVTDSDTDIFDREKVFIERCLKPLMDKVPDLRIVMEHITTKDAADFVARGPLGKLGATITPQHMLHNRNALFMKGLRPHFWCLPVLKREEHRRAVVAAAVSGSGCFFLGSDSAPHPRHLKESACGCAGIFSAPAALPLYATAFESAGRLEELPAFASVYGPQFYGLPQNEEMVTLVREKWTVPAVYPFGDTEVVPMWAGETLEWKVQCDAC
jgi:dihydroorotase